MNNRPGKFTQDDDFVPQAEFDSRAEAEEYALVILAMGLPCLIRESDSSGSSRLEILAGPAHSGAIRREFAAYASEQGDRSGEHIELPVFPPSVGLALLWAAAVFLIFHFQVRHDWVTDRFHCSSLDLFDRGEWWRPFTAMFLHADFSHLLGNVVFGLIFFVLVAYSVGPWFGWLLILISGALANTATAWLRYPAPRASLGASTATFAALGILVGFGAFVAWRTRSYRKLGGHHGSLRRRNLPPRLARVRRSSHGCHRPPFRLPGRDRVRTDRRGVSRPSVAADRGR